MRSDAPTWPRGTDEVPSDDLGHADSLELLKRQSHILELLASGAALADVLAAVAVALEHFMPASRCSVLLLDAERGTLRHGAAPSLPASYSAAIDGMTIGPDSGSCGTAAFLVAPVAAYDIRTDGRWAGFRDLALAHGLRACWSTPILGRDSAVLGTFAVYHDEPHEPVGREGGLVYRLERLASVAIEHARLYGALSESEERFRRAFEDNAVGMALFDMDGKYLRVNQALCEITGRSERALLGSSFLALTHPEDAMESERLWTALTAGDQQSAHLEKRYLRPDGSEVAVAMTASTVRDASGAPLYVSSNVLDITERRAAEEALVARRAAEAARISAERASLAKSDFLSSLSHEMRTPLSAIVGFAELLHTLPLDAERRRTAVENIGSAAAHILAVLDDVLDIAKIEAGAVSIDRDRLPLAPLVQDVLDLVEPIADARGVHVESVGLDERAAASADARRMRQVLLNIVSNGIKYSRPGDRVEVEVRRRPGIASIVVRDTGAGIPAEAQERLFTPFDRLGAERSGEPGAGIGLALSQRLVKAMGGTLRVFSRYGEGTTVEITLDVLP